MKTFLFAVALAVATSASAQISGVFNGDQSFTQRVSLGGNLTVQGSAIFQNGIETATGYGPASLTVNGNATIAVAAGPEFRRLKSIVVNGKLDLSCDAVVTEDITVSGSLQLNGGSKLISARSITINGDLLLPVGGTVRLETTGGSLTIRGRIRGPAVATTRSQLEVSITGGFFRFDGLRDANVDLASSTSSISPKVVLNRLINLSMMLTLTGDSSATMGFVVGGQGEKNILVRAVGPGLSQFRVSGVMDDPKVEVTRGGITGIKSNDWGENPATRDAVRAAMAACGAFALPEGSKDAAVLMTMTPGECTVTVSRNSGAAGSVLVEVYEVPEP
ncbi:MAG: hypothetical protein NTV51_12360 [Verrucomicrobia bacterium]|nr:hypothetical protein [Verrucomicrobiota bacterium]